MALACRKCHRDIPLWQVFPAIDGYGSDLSVVNNCVVARLLRRLMQLKQGPAVFLHLPLGAKQWVLYKQTIRL